MHGSALAAAAGNSELRRVLAAFAALNFAEWGVVTAVAVHAYRVSGLLAVGFVGFRLVPAAIGSLFAGPLAQQHPGSSFLTRVAALRFVIMLVITVALSEHASLSIAIAAIALDALIASPYRPAQAALIPRLARNPAEVVGASAASSVVKSVSQAAGAAAGGLLVAHLSTSTIAGGAAGVIAIAALLTVAMRRSRTGAPSDVAGWSLRVQLHNAVQTMRDRLVAPVILASGLRCLVRGQWTALMVVTALELFHLGPDGVGTFTAAAGLGVLIAVPTTSRLIGRERLARPVSIAFVLCGASVSLVGVIDSPRAASLCILIWGVAMAVADSTSFSTLYRMLTPASLAPTIGILESVKLALEGVGALSAWVLVSLFGIRGALICAGLPLPVTMALMWRRIYAADAVGSDRSMTVALLHRVPLFHVGDMSFIEDVASRVRPEQVRAGVEVIHEGDEGDRFFVIVEGRARVSMSDYPIGDLGPGDVFGERALLRNARRAASVSALTDLSLLTLSRYDFLATVNGSGSTDEPPTGPPLVTSLGSGDDEWTTKMLVQVLGSLALFNKLTLRAVEDLAGMAVVSTCAEGHTLTVQGEEGREFHVILEGKTEVTINGRVVSELRPGDAFGEIALLHNVPRSATVTALTAVTTCTLTREAFSAGIQLSAFASSATDLVS
jgi:CRP-like cAMP-binding protein